VVLHPVNLTRLVKVIVSSLMTYEIFAVILLMQSSRWCTSG